MDGGEFDWGVRVAAFGGDENVGMVGGCAVRGGHNSLGVALLGCRAEVSYGASEDYGAFLGDYVNPRGVYGDFRGVFGRVVPCRVFGVDLGGS